MPPTVPVFKHQPVVALQQTVHLYSHSQRGGGTDGVEWKQRRSDRYSCPRMGGVDRNWFTPLSFPSFLLLTSHLWQLTCRHESDDDILWPPPRFTHYFDTSCPDDMSDFMLNQPWTVSTCLTLSHFLHFSSSRFIFFSMLMSLSPVLLCADGQSVQCFSFTSYAQNIFINNSSLTFI